MSESKKNEVESEIDGEAKEILYRVDERTEHIDSKLENLSGTVEKNKSDIDELQSKVKRNTTLVGSITSGIAVVTIWFADKVSRLF